MDIQLAEKTQDTEAEVVSSTPKKEVDTTL